jgi:hypothetical protein
MKRKILSALEVRETVGELIDYLYDDEKNDYESYETKPRKHIFKSIKKLNDWLGVDRE